MTTSFTYRTIGMLLLASGACRTEDLTTPPAEPPIAQTPILPAALLGQLGFSTFLGGNDGDQIRDIAADAQGNLYVVGGTRSITFPTTVGVYDRTYNGNMDIFVSKFTSTGQLIWSTFLGGPNYDRAYAVEVDAAGDVVVGGRAGALLPGVIGFFGPVFKGGNSVGGYGPQDGFVCKLSGDGRILRFCGYIATLDENITRDVAVDPQRNIYANFTASKCCISRTWTANGYLPIFPGESTNLALKISPDGKQVLGGTYYGGNGNEGGTGTLRWAGGRIYMIGSTSSTNLPTPGGFDHTLGGPSDLYLAVFSDDLRSLVFATYVGGSGDETLETHNAAVDASGNTYIGAATFSPDLPGTIGRFQPTKRSIKDGFVMKIGPTGALLGSTYVGGTGDDTFQGMAVNSLGRVHLSTITSSLDFPRTQTPLGARLGTSAGVVILSPDLKTLLLSELVGGSKGDESRALALGPDGSVYLGGMTQSLDWYRLNPFQFGYGGGTLDGVLFRVITQ